MTVPARSRGQALVRARSSEAARRVLLLVQRFIHTETTGGIVLLAATVLALLWANSPWSASYERFWNSTVALQLGG